MMRAILVGAALLLMSVIAYLLLAQQEYRWALPADVPLPRVPADNPMTTKKVELGRWLFHDARLSVNGTTSCASCHQQVLAFTDGQAQAIGATGERHPRGAMSLVNVGYASRLGWANPLLDRLEIQALTPMFGENPIEMGLAGKEEWVLELLQTDERYRALMPQAFPGDEDPYSILNTVRAIASFVRSIVSFDSPYDRYIGGDAEALNASELRGMTLFFSEKLECFHCHGGLNFTDSSTHANAVVESVGFHNTGLYSLDIDGAYPKDNVGLLEFTGERRDMGRFRAPSLRNVAVTAPYMHDGSVATLEDVVDHYAQGGRTIAAGPVAGDGSRNPYKSVFVREFAISATEKEDLLAFLGALTDTSVLSNPAFSDPFKHQ